MPIEYLRESSKRNLTLVIDENGAYVQTLWALMLGPCLTDAIESLRTREGTRAQMIGRWPSLEQYPFVEIIKKWAISKNIDSVVWTALSPKFLGEDNRKPTLEEALMHLMALEPDTKKIAEEYVRRTPPSIRTPYRVSFEHKLGWEPL